MGMENVEFLVVRGRTNAAGQLVSMTPQNAVTRLMIVVGNLATSARVLMGSPRIQQEHVDYWVGSSSTNAKWVAIPHPRQSPHVRAERVVSSNVMIDMISSKKTCATKPNAQVALDAPRCFKPASKTMRVMLKPLVRTSLNHKREIACMTSPSAVTRLMI